MAKKPGAPATKGRPAPSPLRASLGLAALALLVRLAGMRWGLPDGVHFFSFHPDEFETAGRAIRILNTGNWDPEFFNYGSLFLYLTTLVSWPLYALQIVQTVTGTHVVGRIVSAVFGAATVLVTERIGRRFLDARHARWAALLVAIAPGVVLHSTFATVDTTATFFAALAIEAGLRAREKGGWSPWLLAGAAAGLGAGTKYSTGLAILPVLVATLAPARPTPWVRRILHAGVVKLGALLAFFAAVPYALVTPDLFRDDVTYELLVHPREGHFNYFVGTGDGWSHHLLANLPYVLGPPLAIAAVAGLCLLFVRRRIETTMLLLFAVPYFAGLGLSNVRFLRYLLPMVPALALAAAALVARVESARPAAGRILAWLLPGWAALLTALQLVAMNLPDPRTRAAQWVAANVPPGAAVGLPSVPWFATPPVTPWNGGERTLRHFMREPASWRFVLCEDWDVDALERGEPSVFLMSELDDRDARRLAEPEAGEFFAVLERDYEPVARFSNLDAKWRILFGNPFAPHDWLYPFADVVVWRRG